MIYAVTAEVMRLVLTLRRPPYAVQRNSAL